MAFEGYDGVPAGLLAVTSYEPGADVNTAISSASDADVDGTNLKVTFTAPASGNVLVQVQACLVSTSNVTGVTAPFAAKLSIREGAATIKQKAVENNSAMTSRTLTFYISGLTPGSAHTYKLGAAGDGAIGIRVMYGPSCGPVILMVWSAP